MDKPDNITGAIALKLGADDVTPGDFLACTKAFCELLREMTNQIGGEMPSDAWSLRMREGSQILDAKPNLSRMPQAIADRIASVTLDGMHALERSAKQPEGFTEAALEKVRTLSRRAARANGGQMPIWLAAANRQSAANTDVFNNCSALLAWQYEDIGTVEGKLEAISAVRGRLQFRIYEPVWNRPVRCHFADEDILQEALKLFRCRVEVLGPIRYTKDGLPTSIRVEEITQLPDSSEGLPSYREMRGILNVPDDGRG